MRAPGEPGFSSFRIIDRKRLATVVDLPAPVEPRMAECRVTKHQAIAVLQYFLSLLNDR